MQYCLFKMIGRMCVWDKCNVWYGMLYGMLCCVKGTHSWNDLVLMNHIMYILHLFCFSFYEWWFCCLGHCFYVPISQNDNIFKIFGMNEDLTVSMVKVNLVSLGGGP